MEIWRYSFWVERYNFYLVHGKNTRLMFRFVPCDFPRWSVYTGVNCRRYIRGFIQDGAYLAMSSVAGTFEVLAFVTVLLVLQTKNQLDWQWRKSFAVVGCNFIWFMPKTDQWGLDFRLVIVQDGVYLAMSSVAGTFKLLSFITFLFVLQIKNHLDWP